MLILHFFLLQSPTHFCLLIFFGIFTVRTVTFSGDAGPSVLQAHAVSLLAAASLAVAVDLSLIQRAADLFGFQNALRAQSYQNIVQLSLL
jgi:hypothetical protein